jgi:hypothetical protein
MPLDWETLWVLMLTKYDVYDGEEMKLKMDVIKQYPMQWVQNYYDRLEHLFVKRRILDDERKRWFMAHLKSKNKKLCVVHTYVDMDKLLVSTIEVWKVMGEIGDVIPMVEFVQILNKYVQNQNMFIYNFCE